MEQFLTVNLISIIQLVSFIGGGVWLVSSLKAVQETQSNRLAAIEEELSRLRDVMVSIARQEERMNAMDQRMLTQGKRVDSMFNYLYRKYAKEEETE